MSIQDGTDDLKFNVKGSSKTFYVCCEFNNTYKRLPVKGETFMGINLFNILTSDADRSICSRAVLKYEPLRKPDFENMRKREKFKLYWIEHGKIPPIDYIDEDGCPIGWWIRRMFVSKFPSKSMIENIEFLSCVTEFTEHNLRLECLNSDVSNISESIPLKFVHTKLIQRSHSI